MDIGKIGKVVVDATTGKLIEPETKYLYLTGEVDGQITAAHTWAIGLYTYNNMLSPDENVDEIEHIFWQSYGLREDCLTTYIYDLYKDPKRSRTFKAEEMAAYTKMGARFVLTMCRNGTTNFNRFLHLCRGSIFLVDTICAQQKVTARCAGKQKRLHFNHRNYRNSNGRRPAYL
jgi:hypothetical protein